MGKEEPIRKGKPIAHISVDFPLRLHHEQLDDFNFVIFAGICLNGHKCHKESR